MPIPASKGRGGAQAELEFEEWTQDRVEENTFTNHGYRLTTPRQVARYRLAVLGSMLLMSSKDDESSA